jgi:hypothetical protein
MHILNFPGLPGVRSIIDDILIYGEGDTEEEAIADHDVKFRDLMERCKERNLKLNKDKLSLKMKEVKFIGHLITSKGLKPDPEKVRDILDMPKPTNVSGVRRIIGFVTYLSKFLPKLSDICKPLRKLTLKDSEFCWLDNHDNALDEIKRLVTAKPVLQYYDPKLRLFYKVMLPKLGSALQSCRKISLLRTPVGHLQTLRQDMPKSRRNCSLLYLDSKGFTNIHMEEQFK